MAKKIIGEGQLHESTESRSEEILEHALGKERPDEKDFFQRAINKLVGKQKK
jgi:hypothetical protein